MHTINDLLNNDVVIKLQNSSDENIYIPPYEIVNKSLMKIYTINVIITMRLVIVRIHGSKVNVLGAKKQLEDYYTHMRGKNKEPEG